MQAGANMKLFMFMTCLASSSVVAGHSEWALIEVAGLGTERALGTWEASLLPPISRTMTVRS